MPANPGDVTFAGPVPVSPFYQAMLHSLQGQPSLSSYANQVQGAVNGTMPSGYIGYGTQGPESLPTQPSSPTATPGAPGNIAPAPSGGGGYDAPPRPGGISSGLMVPPQGLTSIHPGLAAYLNFLHPQATTTPSLHSRGVHRQSNFGDIFRGLFGMGGAQPPAAQPAIPTAGWNLADTLLGHGAPNLV